MISGFLNDRQGNEHETDRSQTFWDSNYCNKIDRILEPDHGSDIIVRLILTDEKARSGSKSQIWLSLMSNLMMILLPSQTKLNQI